MTCISLHCACNVRVVVQCTCFTCFVLRRCHSALDDWPLWTTVSVQQCGKKRLILDLRVVNKHLWKQKVRFEDIKVALSYLEKGFYQIKFDLTSAYHFVDIYKPHTEYLGFSWSDKSGNIIYYKFLVLPFGISSACYSFTKLTRPLINKWRGEGKLVTMFLDDGYGCAKDFENTALLSQEVKSDLLLSGFIPNISKCI